MERRSLIATLALVATFAIFSRGLQSGHLANPACPLSKLKAEIACAKHYLADQLVAKFRPFVDRAIPEEPQMVAELNLPVLASANEKIAEAQVQLAQLTVEKNCEAAIRAQEHAMRAQEAGFRAQERSLRGVQRAQERAEVINVRVQERMQEVNARMAVRAQEITVHAVERAQRNMERSHSKMAYPVAMPIHVKVEMASPNFAFPVTVAPEPPSPPTL
jgi:hypothetical protein